MCGTLKLKGEYQTFNGVLLVGDVKSVSKTGFVLTTKNESPDPATGQMRSFEENHSVLMKGKKSFDIGDRVAVKAELIQLGEGSERRTHLQALEAAKAAKDAEYVNLARLIGEVPFPFQYFPKTENKPAFGNLLVKVGQAAYRGVLFASHATAMSRLIKTGAIVKVEGRLQNREYTDRMGSVQSMLEVIANADATAVIKSADQTDRFASWGESMDAELANSPEGDIEAAF